MSLGTSSGGWGLSSLFSWGSSSSSGSSSSKAHARSRLAGGAKGLQAFFFAPVTGSGSPGRNARKIICRYGMGCTHVMDPAHRERFWHPPIPGEMASAAPAGAGTSSSPAKGGVGWGRPSSSGGSAPGGSTGSPSSRGAGAATEAELTDPAAATAGEFACHECGLYFRRLGALRLHLQRKTAWSNRSLVGARVSCLVDCREWQEGLVLEYASATGRHRVAFEYLQQARWMHMKRAAFFIIRRPVPSPQHPHRGRQQQHQQRQRQQERGRAVRSRRRVMELGGGEEADDEGGDAEEEDAEEEEAKQPEIEGKGVWEVEEADRPMEAVLAPLEKWDYAEPLSLGYARAQACLHEAYGRRIQETGHKTLGHLCVTESDKEVARGAKSSLLYGELLPRGINKALLPGRLDGQRARVVYELGMGVGKVAMQCFLQFPFTTSSEAAEPPRRVFGVELSAARYEKAAAAVRRLVAAEAETLEVVERESGPGRIVVRDRRCGSVLEMEEGNLLAVEGIETADIVLLETDLSATIYPDLCALLRRMKPGARAFTYLDLRKIWGVAAPSAPDDDADEAGAAQAEAWDPAAAEAAAQAKAGAFPFRQLDVNRPVSDRYATSWSVNRGHHFYLWVKVLESGSDNPSPIPVGWEGGTDAWLPDAVTPPMPASIAATSSISGQSSSAGSSGGSSSSGTGVGALAPRGKAPPSHHHHHHHHRSHQQGKEERRGSAYHRRAAPVRRQQHQQHRPVRQASSSSSLAGSSGGGVDKALRRFFFGWGKEGSASAGGSPATAAAAVASPPRAYDEVTAAAAASSASSHPQLSASASVDSPLP